MRQEVKDAARAYVASQEELRRWREASQRAYDNISRLNDEEHQRYRTLKELVFGEDIPIYGKTLLAVARLILEADDD